MNAPLDQRGLPAANGSAPPVSLLLVASLATILSLAALKYVAHPFVWIGTCWVGCFGYSALVSRNATVRLFCLNAAIVALGSALSEVVLLPRPKGPDSVTHYEGTRPVINYWLGSAAKPSTVMHAWKITSGRLIFDVRYTTDSLGLRVSPPVSAGHSKGTVLFFGCSFAYGEGLNDAETLPYQVGLASRGTYRVLNFGYQGYGAHEMLSALEHGVVERVVGRDSVRAIVYEGIPHHILRAVGEVSFQRHAPRYRIATDGSVYFAGHFDDPADDRVQRVHAQLEKSRLFHFWAHHIYEHGGFTDEDLRLYLGIISRSRDILADRYPGARFEVLLWGDGSGRDQRIADGLARLGITVERVPNILPGFDGYVRGSQYRLSPADPHPDSLANAILARYVVSHLLD